MININEYLFMLDKIIHGRKSGSSLLNMYKKKKNKNADLNLLKQSMETA